MSGAVVSFPGKPLVAVVSEPGRHSVMLAKIGATAGERQCSFGSLEAAVESARDGAAECGWRYVGIFTPERIQELQRYGGGSESLPPHTIEGPGAA